MPMDDAETELFVETAAGRLACRERGGGDVALVLLHGSGFAKEVFAPLMAHPALGGVRCLAIDLPGHGRSENARQPGRTYSLAGLAESVREVLAARGLAGCVLLGWSLGGDVAMEFLAGGSLVSGVAVVSAPPVPPGILGRLQGYTLTGATLAAKARVSDAEALRLERYSLGASAEGRFVPALRRTDPMMRPQLARSMFTARGTDQRQAVRAARIPVWLVAGAADPLLRLGYFRRFVCECPAGCTPWIVPGAGHAPFLDAPDAFAGALAGFVRCAAGRAGLPRSAGGS